MATIGEGYLTLSDHAKRIEPDGKIAMITELLARQNPMLEDMPFVEANGVYGHLTTVRTGLPGATWKKLNNGVAFTKSRTAQITESIGIQEQRSALDEDHPGAMKNLASLRLSEARPHLISIANEFESTALYGSTNTDPEQFMGLEPRYNSLSAANGQNIIDAGGSGSDNTSIWLVGWGSETLHGIFPQGSSAGIRHKDLGLQQLLDDNSNYFSAYVDQWKMSAGLVVKDWRYAVRIANIDVSNLVANSSAADIAENMILALNVIESLSGVRPYFYMNRTVKAQLDLQRHRNVAGAGMTYSEVDGKMIPHFQGIPVRVSDAILETEAQVT